MAGGRSQPSYFNPTDETHLDYITADGTHVGQVVSPTLSGVAFEDVAPARGVTTWKGKNVYEGLYWCRTTRDFVRHESFLEREYLRVADFDVDIVGIQWQPFVLRWPKNTPKNRGHVPDYFVRLSNGLGRVVDVKAPGGLEGSASQFAMTQEVCDLVGWSYEVFSGTDEVYGINLKFLDLTP